MFIGGMNMLVDILYLVGGLIVGLVAGFFISQKITKKQLKENPPINEKMVRTLMEQMGRKPSQKQVNQTMKAMNKFNN